LPASMRPMLDILERYGFIILLVLIWAGLINAIISPIIGFISYLLFLGVR